VARTFDKTAANNVQCGTSTIGTRLNGASKISFHALASFTGSINTSGSAENRLLQVIVNGAASGVFVNVDATAGISAGKLRIGGRSVSGDASLQVVSGATSLTTNTLYSFGGMIDIGGDTITVYLNGAVDAGPTGVTFGNATYTQGTPTQQDGIGGEGVNPAPFTVNQWPGTIAELALWDDDIGAAGFLALHKRASALLVKPANLVWYSRLVENVIIDIIGGTVATINGTVAKSDHPRVTYTGWPLVSVTGSGAEPDPPYDQGAETSLGSFNQMIYRRAWR
jgi:hypothetical protein